MTDDSLYSTIQISEMFGIASTTLARAVRKGKLRSIRVGRSYALKVADVKAWMESDYQPDMAKRNPSKAKVNE